MRSDQCGRQHTSRTGTAGIGLADGLARTSRVGLRPRHALCVAIVAATAGVVGHDVALTLNAHGIYGDEAALPAWAAKRWTRPARLNSDTNRSPRALNATPWGAVTMPGRHFEGSV